MGFNHWQVGICPSEYLCENQDKTHPTIFKVVFGYWKKNE